MPSLKIVRVPRVKLLRSSGGVIRIEKGIRRQFLITKKVARIVRPRTVKVFLSQASVTRVEIGRRQPITQNRRVIKIYATRLVNNGNGTLVIKDEGIELTNRAHTLDFVGELVTTTQSNGTVTVTISAGGLVPFEYDCTELSDYVGANAQTVTYKQGGPGGTIVAVLAIEYDGNGNVLSVQRS